MREKMEVKRPVPVQLAAALRKRPENQIKPCPDPGLSVKKMCVKKASPEYKGCVGLQLLEIIAERTGVRVENCFSLLDSFRDSLNTCSIELLAHQAFEPQGKEKSKGDDVLTAGRIDLLCHKTKNTDEAIDSLFNLLQDTMRGVLSLMSDIGSSHAQELLCGSAPIEGTEAESED